MNDLRSLTRWFAALSTHPEGARRAALLSEPLLGGAGLDAILTSGPRLSAAERVQIYNDAYFARLCECLEDDYPTLAYALGEASFAQLARAYIEEHPSRSPSLNRYGSAMADFCARSSESWAAFAADLARLEWAMVEVVHAPSGDVLSSDALQNVPPTAWPSARLRPNSALRFLTFDYPVNDFLQEYREEGQPTVPPGRASATAVYRVGLKLWRMDVAPRAALLLEDLLLGEPLASAIAGLEQRAANDEERAELAQLLPTWLNSWVKHGLFAAIDLE